MSKNLKRVIVIFGSGSAGENEPVFQMGVQLGKMLAEAEFAIANGGYDGTMRAAAKGAAGVGGKIYGVTCTAFRRGGANKFITDEIATDNLEQRLRKLVELGDGYVVLPGGTGTLLELAWVWEHKNKHFETAGKPVVLLGAFWKPLVKIMTETNTDCGQCIQLTDTPEQATEYLKQYFTLAEKK
jgi:uncharacterized protein (TIGR00725 family)